MARHIAYDATALRVQTVPTGGGLLGQTVTTTNTQYGRGVVSDQKTGVDVDSVAGYDFGLFRLEGEVGYKSSRLSKLIVSNAFLTDINTAPISGVTAASFTLGKHTSVLSGMVNALLEYHLVPGVRIYGGGGVGRARAKSLGDRDSVWAFQAIAGASVPIAAKVEIGLKYCYFQTQDLNFSGGASFSNAATGATSVTQLTERGKFRSNSLLVSLIYKLD